jgi:hypothetical protein
MLSPVDREKKNKRIALASSLGIHALLLIVFIFLIAWRAPDPPLPEFGIELNFGLDTQGDGEQQPDDRPGSEETNAESLQPAETLPKEEVVEEKADETQVISKLESPVVVKEEKKEPVVEKPKEKVEKTEKVSQPVEKKEDTRPVVAETVKGKDTPSHGDDPGKTGDKGSPQGKPDAKALYGKPGGGVGGVGISLSMSGWEWAEQPKIPELPDNEDGRIVFDIECDEEGEIVQITTTQRGLSPKAEQLLKEVIRKNSLVRTSSGRVPERSKGTIVFVLKTK